MLLSLAELRCPFFSVFTSGQLVYLKLVKPRSKKEKHRERAQEASGSVWSRKHPAKRGFTSSVGLPTSFSLFRSNTSEQAPSLQARPAIPILHPGDLAQPRELGAGQAVPSNSLRIQVVSQETQRGEDTHWSHRVGGRPESSGHPPSSLGRSPPHPGPSREQGLEAVERGHLGKTRGCPVCPAVASGVRTQPALGESPPLPGPQLPQGLNGDNQSFEKLHSMA